MSVDKPMAFCPRLVSANSLAKGLVGYRPMMRVGLVSLPDLVVFPLVLFQEKEEVT